MVFVPRLDSSDPRAIFHHGDEGSDGADRGDLRPARRSCSRRGGEDLSPAAHHLHLDTQVRMTAIESLIVQARTSGGIPPTQRMVPFENIGALLRMRAGEHPDK